jgi:type VI secretion system secreted protein VgrG
MGIETTRETEFHCPLGPDVLMVREFVGTERMSVPFEYHVTLYSKDHNIEMESLLGQHASVEVRFELRTERYFDGIVCDFSHQGFEEDYAVYAVTLRPWFWLLSRNRKCRVFQGKTAMEIARDIFSERGFSDLEVRLFAGLTPRDYCVQYNESDLDFISRLFEHEGIYYYFQHERGKHTMVLADSISAHEPLPDFETIAYKQVDKTDVDDLGYIEHWSVTKQMVPGGVSLNDYDFKKPRAVLQEDRVQPKSHPHASSALYFYPGHYVDPAVGADNALVRLEETQVPYDLARGTTQSKWLSVGVLFSLERHPRDDQNREYLILSTHYEIDAGPFRSQGGATARMSTHFTVLESQTPFRPARVTPVPFVSGPQTAVVVGPKGQEIWTDEFGRVKVQFAWDRLGKHDESSSCWIRVSQAWAGPGWGSIYIPRIGQEVLVEFIDGDLDRPVVTGRAYNSDNPTPYDLPNNAAQSGVKSASLKGDKNQYNELRFDDTAKAEEIKLRAQRNLTTLVRSDSSTSIGHNHTHTVKKDMKVVVSEGDYNTTVSKGWMLSYVPKSVYDVCAKEIVQSADDSITFQVKDVSIRLDSKSISLNVGTSTEIKLDLATLTIIGPKVDINPMGGIPKGPAGATSKAESVAAPSEDPGDKEFSGGGGKFGGGGASGSWK